MFFLDNLLEIDTPPDEMEDDLSIHMLCMHDDIPSDKLQKQEHPSSSCPTREVSSPAKRSSSRPVVQPSRYEDTLDLMHRSRKPKRISYTERQRRLLLQGFQAYMQDREPWAKNGPCMRRLCKDTGLSHEQISKWFYHRRTHPHKERTKPYKSVRFPKETKLLLNAAFQEYIMCPDEWNRYSQKRIALQEAADLTFLQVQRFFTNAKRKSSMQFI